MKLTFATRILTVSTLVLFFFLGNSFSQISQGGVPFGLDLGKNLLQHAPLKSMPSFDIDGLRAEDEVRDLQPGQPYRFGYNFDVNFNLSNSGIWQEFEDGSKIWRLAIESKGALSLNFAFDNFKIPEGARLFIYTSCGKNVIGAFTSYNNQHDGYFATAPISGDNVILEYFEPSNKEFEGTLNIYRVTHGYRGVGESFEKGFGHSGACNMNVACPEAADWDKQIRSVARIIRNGGDWCTGVLINNTENDGTPYFLSANHCFASEGSLVFIFNWQSETCANPTSAPPIVHTISGAVTRARNSTSDVWLLEFNNPVPEEFNAYFSGWNRELGDAIPGYVFGIHHPSGDIKKFSFSESGVTRASYLGAPNSGTSHWRVTWDGGTTTEGGSSGSPIFDSNGRIIGQLHGGYAACGNVLPDWYGRFGVSMNNVLGPWLDPNNTGVVAIDGYDPLLDATDPGAPATVTDLSLEPAENGGLSALVSWINPTETFSGQTLTELTAINVYRNDELVHSIESPQIGGDVAFYDENIDTSDYYTYVVRGENSAGEGPIIEVSGYVGYDRPGPVGDLNLEAVGNDGLLTWSPPTYGQHDAFYETSSLTHYQITRNPDNVVFEIQANEVEFLDTSVPIMGNYTYTIAGVNQSGIGAEVTSNPALLASEGAIFMTNGESTTCNATFFDSGGPDGNYSNNESFIYTFHPGIENSNIRVEFLTFDVESHWNCNWDRLLVYDGPNTESTLLGRFCGTSIPGPFTATNGSLTFHFISDVTNVGSGWSAVVSCYGPFHNVSFTVTDNEAVPIEGALVIVDDEEVLTDENGIAVFEGLQAGEMEYLVIKEGYLDASGNFLVEENSEVSVQLSPLSEITFSIRFNQQPVDGASVLINNQTINSNQQGFASISLPAGSYDYVVSKIGYQEVTGQVTVSGQNIQHDVVLLPLFTVTFQVHTSGGPLSPAEIRVGDYTLHTNETGHADLALVPGSYNYEVTYLDFPTFSGSFNVVDENVFVGVLLETSITDLTPHEVKIFPNPFGSRLFMAGTAELTKVVISNINGQELLRISNNGQEKMEVQTGNLPAGIYLITLYGKNKEVFTHKVVKN